MELPNSATVSEIAAALGVSRVAINNRARTWTPENETGVRRYALDAVSLRAGEVKKVRAFLARRSGKVIPLHADADRQQAALEKEQERLAARAESLEKFPRLPERQRAAAEAKLQLIQAAAQFLVVNNKLGRTAGQDLFCHEYLLGRIDIAPDVRAAVPHLHPGTLRAWIAAEYEQGMMGLVDMYGNRKGQSKIETYITGIKDGKPVKPLADTILALIARYPHIKPKRIAEYLPGRCPDAPHVSAKSIERWIDAWKASHAQEWDYLVNPDNWKNRHLTAAGQLDEHIRYQVNARWEIDATPADLLLTDGRNKIIGLIDVGTRRLILQVTPTEKGLDNARVVRRGILAWGVPKEGIFVTDQGNPYKSEIFRRFLDGLAIAHEFCAPFSGDRKPFIERSFRTFSHDLVELLPGYIGHSVADRKQIEARKSFAQRLMKKGEVIEAKLTAAELQAFCDRWCAAYHDREHGTLGKSPNQVVAAWPGAIHRIADERALDLLLSPVAGKNGWRTIAKGVVRIDRHEYLCGEFGRFPSGQQVQVLETDDIGRVVVNTMNEHGVMEFVGIAECPELTGISRAEVSAVTRARQRRVIAEVNELKKELRKELTGEDVATAVLERREREAAERDRNVARFPRPAIDYTTPGLQAAADAAAMLDMTPATPELPANVAAIRDRFVAEISAPAVNQVFDIPFNDRDKYTLWCELDGKLAGGLEIPEPALKFYEAFKTRPAWRNFRGIDDDIYSLRRD